MSTDTARPQASRPPALHPPKAGAASERAPSRRRPGRLRAPGRDVFHVDLDTFYVSVERVRDPSLHGRPVIVGGLPGERGVVACASYEARTWGARAGMPLFQAAALCPPETVFLHGDHAAYLEATKRVMAILDTFTPQVEAVSLDEAYLDMTGLERHHRSWLAAATAIHDAVARETGLSISIGIGGTRAVAKIAANLAKPGGVVEVRRGEERAFLAALPLELLPGVGPRMRHELARFNLHTVGDLAEVPADVLEETFGVGGSTLSRRARGIESSEDEPPVGRVQPKTRSISRETSFARDTDDPQFIDGMVSYLAQRATKALRKAGFLARAVGVKIRYADFKTVEARHRLRRPSDVDDEILALARTLWRQRYERRVRLRLVGVVLHDLVEVGDRQLQLPFDHHPITPAHHLIAPAHPPAAPSPLPRTAGAGGGLEAAVAHLTPEERLDHAVDVVRDRHGFGSLVRGNAVELFGKLSRSHRGFRLHTPACSR